MGRLLYNNIETTVLYFLGGDYNLNEEEITDLDNKLDGVMHDLLLAGYFLKNIQDDSCSYKYK